MFVGWRTDEGDRCSARISRVCGGSRCGSVAGDVGGRRQAWRCCSVFGERVDSAAVNAAKRAGGGLINVSAVMQLHVDDAIDGENDAIVITRIGVNGNGATINGSDAVRIFEVDGTGQGNLSLNSVTLTHGSAGDFGGAILNSNGAVTLNRSTVTENTAVTAGGGIASGVFGPAGSPKLTLNNSVVTGNPSPGTGNFDGVGGGIANNHGEVTLNSSWVNGNSAGGPQGGGIATGNLDGAPESDRVVDGEQQSGQRQHRASAGGGGIQNLSGRVTLNSTQVNGNTSLNGGGIASGNGNGGTPPNPALLVLNQSEVNENTATAPPGSEGPPIAAGGIANGGTAILNSTTVDNNKALHTSGGRDRQPRHHDPQQDRSERQPSRRHRRRRIGRGNHQRDRPGCADDPHDQQQFGEQQLRRRRRRRDRERAPEPEHALPGGTLTINGSQITGNRASLVGGGIFNVTATVTLSRPRSRETRPDNCEPTGSIAGCTG